MSQYQKKMNFSRRMGEGDTLQSHRHSSTSSVKRSHSDSDVVEKKVHKESTFVKLSQGQLVYVKDDKEGWIAGTVVDIIEKGAVVLLKNRETNPIKAQREDILLRSEDTIFTECCSLTEVTPLNEASVLDCLHQRFSHDVFYTLAGTTIIAVNPFKELPGLYSTGRIWEYHRSQIVLCPHIYQIAEKAYNNMVRELGRVDQSIVVSGESGAGKTVSAKHLLRYLTIVSSPELETDVETSIPGSAIEQRVLDSNPILEAFGNAATPRNDNSSRFGKFIQLQFHRNGSILGGVIQTYLLEKTRVVHQGVGENNFHIFYQVMSLANARGIPQWLEEIRSEIGNSKLQCTVPQQEENLSVLQTVDAMTDIGIAPATQVSIFQVLLAILHLSSLKFLSSKDDEASALSDDDEVSNWSKDQCCRLLGISPLSLHQVLLNRNIVSGVKARRSVFVKPVGVSEAQSRRDCLAMLLYSRLFDWLVSFINHQIKATDFDHTISLLDIYGFEAFNLNGLEQLCINYANERLQQHYVTYFLRDLQTEYENEHIPWVGVSYCDNKMCVETLDRPTGVFGVLNEEVYLSRKSNDYSLCGRIVGQCGLNGIVGKPHAGTYETKFSVRHYAGDVLYTVEGALTKNKDNIPAELISLMATSSNSFILSLFSDDEFAQTEQSLTPDKVKKKKTVLTKFKSSLDALMSSLEQSDVHYIRCIKPNVSSKAGQFDRRYVLQQLRACGTLETVDICRMGYPARMTYHDFIQRYGVFIRLNSSKYLPGLGHTPCVDSLARGEPAEENKENEEGFLQKVESHLSLHEELHHHTGNKRLRRRSGMNAQEHEHQMCACILMAAFTREELQNSHLQFGLHKIFLTQAQLEHLEHTRAKVISALVAKVQAIWRMFTCRHHFKEMQRAAVKLQADWRRYHSRKKFCETRFSAVKIQKSWRAYKIRMAVKKLAQSSWIVKRSLTTWMRRRRFHAALKELIRLSCVEDSSECSVSLSSHNDEVDQPERSTRTGSACDMKTRTVSHGFHVDAIHCLGKSTGSGSLTCDFTAPTSMETAPENKRSARKSQTFLMTDKANEDETDDDFSGDWSDDSGVMIKDDTHSFPIDPSFEAPPAKRQRTTLRSDLRMGNGIVTCRRLTRPGFRFHVRKSVLQHGHVIHHAELPHGLPDALAVQQGLDLQAAGEFGMGCSTDNKKFS